MTKIGHPERPGENSVEGDPVWYTDNEVGPPQFIDSDTRKSYAYYDYDANTPFFYGLNRGFLRVCQKTGKHKFCLDPKDRPFRVVEVKGKLQF